MFQSFRDRSNPYNEEEYLLGIMLDGESYKQCVNTKDREVAQFSVLQGLGWKLHRIWTMDWWDNRDKEISKLLQILDEQKAVAFDKYQEICPMDNELEEVNERVVEPEAKESESEIEITEKADKTDAANEAAVQETEELIIIGISEKATAVKASMTATIINMDDRFILKASVNEKSEVKEAAENEESSGTIVTNDPAELAYRVEEFVSADPMVTPMATSDYIQKNVTAEIAAKLQQIIDAEAPINYNRLAKKALRAFNIGRSSAHTLEAIDKAVRKTISKTQKQAGVKFVWRKDQDPDTYRIYRIDVNSDDKRSWDEVSQQELKNAICVTLAEKGALDKDALVKETIRTMGYGRSGATLVAAVNRGLKYGRKTKEIVINENKLFELNHGE